MRRAKTIKPSDISFETRLLHQSLVTGGDGLGHGEMVGGTFTDILQSPDRCIPGKRRGNEPGLAFVVLPHRGVERAFGSICEDIDFLVLIARTIRPSRCSICDGSHGTSR
jgi:hypothetical protein